MKKPSPINLIAGIVLAISALIFVLLFIVYPSLNQDGVGQDGEPTFEAVTADPTEEETAEVVEATTEPATSTPEPTPTTIPLFNSRIAYISEAHGAPEIYTMNPDGSDPLRLTENEAVDLNPVWSPWGNKIAFISDRGGTPDIYVMDSNGLNVNQITDTVDYESDLAWSPDGSAITYLVTGALNFRLYVTPEDLTTGIWVESGVASYEWSPDGSMIAFTSYLNDREAMEIYLFDTASLTTTQIPIEDIPYIASVSWHPDGSQLVFTGSENADDPNDMIYRINVDGSELTPLLPEPMNVITAVKWSPTQELLAFFAGDVPQDMTTDLTLVDMTGAVIPLAPSIQPWSFDWSPDGTQIVYQTVYENGNSVIGVINIDQSALSVISDESTNSLFPVWSPILGE